jgi:FkbM family methyltransferase
MLLEVHRIAAMNGGATELVRFRNLAEPLEVRPGTNDIETAVDTVVRKEYGRWLPEKVGVLVDAGAFIGDTSAWYLSRFQDANVWALEPNPENRALAERNLARYGNRAVVLPLALSGREEIVHFDGTGTAGSIGKTGYEVRTTTVPELLKIIPSGQIDVLKIDIEGAELDVFEANPQAWLPKVGLIIAELHGPEITKRVLDILAANNMSARQYRSVWYCAHKPGH